jgi:hypothetical protein
MDAFHKWIITDPKHYLIRAWRLMIADYWYYEQTKQLARTHWDTEMCIIQDIDVLLKASDSVLREIMRREG